MCFVSVCLVRRVRSPKNKSPLRVQRAFVVGVMYGARERAVGGVKLLGRGGLARGGG